jgi:hypothetical protein
VSQVPDLWDDEQLLQALREAMRARQAVPPEFIEAGKNAYAWHNIDAELAQLTYDSSADKHLSASMRSETAALRALTFTSAHISIELEVTEHSLVGQVMPPKVGTVETRTQSGVTATAPVDEIGCFSIEPIPASPFRMHWRTEDGTDVVTGWITL